MIGIKLKIEEKNEENYTVYKVGPKSLSCTYM